MARTFAASRVANNNGATVATAFARPSSIPLRSRSELSSLTLPNSARHLLSRDTSPRRTLQKLHHDARLTARPRPQEPGTEDAGCAMRNRLRSRRADRRWLRATRVEALQLVRRARAWADRGRVSPPSVASGW